MRTRTSFFRLAAFLIGVTLVGALLAGIALGGASLFFAVNKEPAPWSSSCSATVDATSVRLTPEQARNAAIITGVAGKRGLPPRAASIGLATAMQESGLRNLDYGDRDSLGLFQQRPSMGWGTAEEVQDPWYASNAFYAAMEKVDGWETADIGDVAQKVQRSGFPDAYDKHVPDARILASALSGETPAAFTCSLVDTPTGDPAALKRFLTKTMGSKPTVTTSGETVTVKAPTVRSAWSAAAIAIADAGTDGTKSLGIADQSWQLTTPTGTPWTNTAVSGANSKTVVITT